MECQREILEYYALTECIIINNVEWSTLECIISNDCIGYIDITYVKVIFYI